MRNLVRLLSVAAIAVAASSPAIAEKKQRPKKADVQRKSADNAERQKTETGDAATGGPVVAPE